MGSLGNFGDILVQHFQSGNQYQDRLIDGPLFDYKKASDRILVRRINGQAVNPIVLAAIPINNDNGTRTIVNNKIFVSFQLCVPG